MKKITKWFLCMLLILILVLGGGIFIKNRSGSKRTSNSLKTTLTIKSSSSSKSTSSSTSKSSSETKSSSESNTNADVESDVQSSSPTETSEEPSSTQSAPQSSSTPAPTNPSNDTPVGSKNGGSAIVTTGKLDLDKTVPVYASSDKNIGVVYSYPEGSVYFDKYFNENGEWWYSYVSYDGTRYYIAYSDVGH